MHNINQNNSHNNGQITNKNNGRNNKFFVLEIWISYLLRGGVILCGLIIATGWALELLYGGQNGDSAPFFLKQLSSGQELKVMPVPVSFPDFLNEIHQLEPRAIIAMGLFCLISLPVLRVAFATVVFIVQKDFIFVAFSGAVLIILTFGLFYGKAL